MKRKNFAFRYQWTLAIAHLSPLERVEVYEQTIRYARTGKACFNSGLAAVAFNTYILPDFERRAKAAEYRARLKERRLAQMEQAKVQAERIQTVVQPIPAPTPEVVPSQPVPSCNKMIYHTRDKTAAECEDSGNNVLSL